MDTHNKSYFELFSLPESFQLDLDQLTSEFKKRQAQHHPDKVINESDSVRLRALQTSSLLNDAFTTLQSPLKRAAYLLTLHGVDPEENNQSHLGSDFLFQQISLREQLETIGKNDDLDKLEIFKASLTKEMQDYLQQFETFYTQANYIDAKPVYSKLQFLYKLLSEIDAIEESLLGY